MANQDPNIAENVTVSVKDPVSGDWENLVLNETGANTGVFMNSWQVLGSSTGAVTQNDSSVETSDGNIIGAKYYSLSDTALMLDPGKGIVKFVDEADAEVDQYVAGDEIYVRLEDSNANQDSTSVEDLNVTVINTITGDVENISLEETGADTGVFTNSAAGLLSSRTATAQRDGVIDARNGDILNVTYNDSNPADFSSYDEVKVVDAILEITKTANKTNLSAGEAFYYTITVTNLGLGSALHVEIKDIIPSNITSHNDTANTSDFYHSSNGRRHIWNFTSLAPGESIVFIINVTVNASAGQGNITNNASLDYKDSSDRSHNTLYSQADVSVPEFTNIIAVALLTMGGMLLLLRKKKRKEYGKRGGNKND